MVHLTGQLRAVWQELSVRAVLKYVFSDSLADIGIPWSDSSRVTFVGNQEPDRKPNIWVDQPIKDSVVDSVGIRVFTYIATGNRYNESNWDWVGTAKIADGYLMWHVLASKELV